MKDSLLTDWGERGIRHAIHIKQLCRSGDRMDTNVHKESNVCSRTARKDETLETLKFNDGFIKATAAGTPKLFLKLFFLFRFHTSASPTVQFRYQWWQRVCVCVCIHRRPLPSRPEAETQWNTAWSRTAAVPPGSPSPPHPVASSACDSWRCGYFSGWIPATTARRSLDKGRRRHKGKEERWGGFGFRPLPWLSLFSLIL